MRLHRFPLVAALGLLLVLPAHAQSRARAARSPSAGAEPLAGVWTLIGRLDTDTEPTVARIVFRPDSTYVAYYSDSVLRRENFERTYFDTLPAIALAEGRWRVRASGTGWLLCVQPRGVIDAAPALVRRDECGALKRWNAKEGWNRLVWKPAQALVFFSHWQTLKAIRIPVLGGGDGRDASHVVGPDEAYYGFKVDKKVEQIAGTGSMRYPEALFSKGIEGEVVAQFVVDTLGRAEPATFKALKSSHQLFTAAVRDALPTMRFTPAEVGGRKVRQLIQQPFTFSLH
jgi:TonB family protein